MNLFTPPKKAVGTLKGVNGNANVLIGRFKELARDDGWSRQEAQQVADFARSKDYNGLIEVLNEHLFWY
ncbi:hypothetical protein [Psychrobacter sp. TWP2-1-2]|uniref:hypothetical protein n=1 Tax=Psychrobacter sp. TWP2-1-2 TaxID=2804623 RepID=UPI003CF76F4D